MAGPLTGVRIVDMTTVLMGPYATQILGDMGADVIKVEPPSGDGTRELGPMRNPGMGPLFMHVNRSKRSIVLDLKKPSGHAALLRIAKTADVLIYNVRPQAMERLKLSYAELATVNPRLIYVGTFGFGQSGPYAARPAYDDLIQGAVSLPTLAQLAGADRPRYVPCTIADRTVGLNAVAAVAAALFHRERTGEGQSIEIPMFETMAQFVIGDHMAGLTFDPPLGPSGYPRLLAKERRPYATKDGYVCALIYNDKQWKSFFDLIDHADILETDPRFADLGSRTRHIDELYQLVGEIFATRTTAEWLQALDVADIPVMPLHTVESLLEDPHMKAIDFFETVEHPSEGRIRSMAVPGTWSRSQPTVARHAPRLGEHTREILREAGFGEGEINKLIAEKVTLAP
ncbi:MAG TPA: CoA transferase [Burkholderiales bacterium]|nr:CoA transferase [Burkholderiales bacterium]